MNQGEWMAQVDITAEMPGERYPTLDDYASALKIIEARQSINRARPDRPFSAAEDAELVSKLVARKWRQAWLAAAGWKPPVDDQ